jgi:hypothetical protein
VVLVAVPRSAEAWIFPEHAELTRFALDDELPVTARKSLQVMLGRARAELKEDYSAVACWTAYGDGYLDGPNARRIAEASALLSAQVALAFDAGRGKSPTAWGLKDRALLAKLLNPVPAWTLSAHATLRLARERPLQEAFETVVLSGAVKAVEAVARASRPLAATSGAASATELGRVRAEFVASPLMICDKRAADARHGVGPSSPGEAAGGNGELLEAASTEMEVVSEVPAPTAQLQVAEKQSERDDELVADWLCSNSKRLRFGQVDFSLIRPILALWPARAASLSTVRGADSFGAGLAGQAIYGTGATAAFHEDAPWGIAFPAFGFGLAVRADSLLPGSRVNREVFSLNVAAFPMFLAGVEKRYLFTGMTEIARPIVGGASRLVEWA